MNVIIFDTETVGKVSQDLLNVGYTICDIDIQHATKKILQKRDYLVGSLYNNKIYMLNDDFVGIKKYSMYENLLATKGIIKRSIPQIFKTLENDLKRHHVLFGYAYNCNFDIDKFEKTSLQYGLKNPFQDLPIFDIWAYATNYICNLDNYKKWARDNEILTDSKIYISTSVESVCKYLYDNLEFIEDHTALSDTQHELNILLECVNRGCDITRPMKNKRFIPSEIKREKIISLPNGEEIKIEYQKEIVRNGKTIFK